MNLTLFFRLVLMSIFQSGVTYSNRSIRGEKMSYDNTYFFCPVVFAKDGFSISLQINHGNYCSSENGYRKFGHTMQNVEFGYPSVDDILLHEYSEMYSGETVETFSAVGTVGSIPVSVLEELFTKHGGIDWEKTISVEQCLNKFINLL